MKKLTRITKISICIFLFITILSFTLAYPLFKKLGKIVDNTTNEMCRKVTELTGLNLSYDSISPSIFSYFGIKGIKFTDENNELVLGIKNTHITYKIKPLLKGDYSNFVKGVSIDGIDIELFSAIELVQRFSGQKNQKNAEFDINQIISYVPPNVTVKNLNILYNKDSLFASLLVKEIKVLNSLHKDSITFEVNSNATIKNGKKINSSGNIEFNGTLNKELDDSFVYIRFADFVYNDYKFNKMNFLAAYNKNKFELRTIQNVIPVSLNAIYDISENSFNVSFKSDDLKPLSVFSKSGDQKNLKILKNMNINLDANLDYQINENKLNYNSNGNIYLPETLIPEGAVVSYELSGNDKKINIKKLNVDGPNCSTDINLSFIYKTFQLDGLVDLQKYILPNGNLISTEVYFDPLDSAGFMVFSPQIFIGERALTALQARVMPQEDSFDFDFEITDFSHIDESNEGLIEVDGSYLLSSNYIQTSVSLNNIYVETILGIAKQLVNLQTAEKIEKSIDSVSNYMFSGETYLSTDLKSVSYNVPYLVLANTKVDNQLVMIALNGNEQSIQLNKFDMIYGSVALNATASIDSMPDSQDKFYTIDIMSSSIPYHFSGSIMPEVITLSGDYGTDAEVRFDKDNAINGYASFENLPFIIGSNTFITSLNTSFDYSKEQGPQFTIPLFQIEQNKADSSVNPRLVVSGSGTKYGAQLTSISYTDLYSNLNGTSDITVNFDNKIFNSAGINMNLKDDLSDEELIIDAMVANPDGIVLTGDNILNSLYVNAMIDTSHFSLNRFMNVKNSNNELSASMYLSGTLEHPYATASIHKLTFLVNDEIVTSTGDFILEEKDVTINNFQLKSKQWSVTEVIGQASLNDFQGSMTALFTTEGEKTLNMPLRLDISDVYFSDSSKLPESLTAKLSCEQMGGSLMKTPVLFDISLMYSPDFISIYSSDNVGLVGTYSKEDGLYALWNMNGIISTEITGNFAKNKQFLKMSNVNIDLSRLFDNMNIDEIINIEKGILKGSLTMTGPFDTPEFKGALSITEPVFSLPVIFPQKLSTEKILLTSSNNEFLISEETYRLKNVQKFTMNSHISLNKWSVDRFDMNLQTLPKQLVPVKIENQLITLSGDTECNLSIIWENYNWDFTGSIFAENLEIFSDIGELSNKNNAELNKKEESVTTDLLLKVGTHASLNFNPLLRCVFVPNTTINCKIDTESELYQLDGSLLLKSGDVSYLSRSFYIKEGSIKFNPSEISNPQVTIKAETREKDTQGNTVRIILSAENQYLLDFNPKFTSVPPKSENEIKLLLGQIVLADSETVGDLVLSAGDYYLNSTVVRQIENKLRDSLNFDIFSVRTNILQNTISTNSQRKMGKEMTLGNVFDNSTVYIGKYIGSALYVDAMLNMTASDNPDVEYYSTDSILFQPEFGLELELPVINIRWDMAWDLTSGIKLRSYIPSTSVTLSWKFNF